MDKNELKRNVKHLTGTLFHISHWNNFI